MNRNIIHGASSEYTWKHNRAMCDEKFMHVHTVYAVYSCVWES